MSRRLAPLVLTDRPVRGQDLVYSHWPAGVRVSWNLRDQQLWSRDHRLISIPDSWAGTLPTMQHATFPVDGDWCLDAVLEPTTRQPLPGLAAPHAHTCAVVACLQAGRADWGDRLRLCVLDLFLADPRAWPQEPLWPLRDRAAVAEALVRQTLLCHPHTPLAILRMRPYTPDVHDRALDTALARGKPGIIVRDLDAGYRSPIFARVVAFARATAWRVLPRGLVCVDDAGYEVVVRLAARTGPVPAPGDRVVFLHHGITKNGAYRSPKYVKRAASTPHDVASDTNSPPSPRDASSPLLCIMSLPVETDRDVGDLVLKWNLAGKRPIYNLSNFDSTDFAKRFQEIARGGSRRSPILDIAVKLIQDAAVVKQFNTAFKSVDKTSPYDKEPHKQKAQEIKRLIGDLENAKVSNSDRLEILPDLYNKLNSLADTLSAEKDSKFDLQFKKALKKIGDYAKDKILGADATGMEHADFGPMAIPVAMGLYKLLGENNWKHLAKLFTTDESELKAAHYNGIYPFTERFYDQGVFIGDKIQGNVVMRDGSASLGEAHKDLHGAIKRMSEQIGHRKTGDRLTSSSNHAKRLIDDLLQFLDPKSPLAYDQRIMTMQTSEIHGSSVKRRKTSNVIERDRKFDFDAKATVQERLEVDGIDDASKFEMFIVKLAYYGAVVLREAFAHALIDEKFVQLFLEKNDFRQCTKGGVWRATLNLSNFKDLIEKGLKPLVAPERLKQLESWLLGKYCPTNSLSDLDKVSWTYIVSAFSNSCGGGDGSGPSHSQKTIYIQLVSNLSNEFIACVSPLFQIENGTNNRYIMSPFQELKGGDMQGLLLGGTPYVVRNPQSLINVNTFLGKTGGAPDVNLAVLGAIWEDGLKDRQDAFAFWRDVFDGVQNRALFNSSLRDHFRRKLLDPTTNSPIIALSWPLLSLFGLVEDPGNSREWGDQVNILRELTDYFHPPPGKKDQLPSYMLETFLHQGVSKVVNQPVRPFVCGILLDMLFSAVMHKYGSEWGRVEVQGYTNAPVEVLFPYYAIRELMTTRKYDAASLNIPVWSVPSVMHECYTIDFSVLRYVAGFYAARGDRTTLQVIDQLRARIIRIAYEPQTHDLADAYKANFVKQFTEPPWGGSYAQVFSQIGTQLAGMLDPSIVGAISRGTFLSTSMEADDVPAFFRRNQPRRMMVRRNKGSSKATAPSSSTKLPPGSPTKPPPGSPTPSQNSQTSLQTVSQLGSPKGTPVQQVPPGMGLRKLGSIGGDSLDDSEIESERESGDEVPVGDRQIDKENEENLSG